MKKELAQQQQQRDLSSLPPKTAAAEENDNSSKQPFVKYKIEPGEWDANRTDPYHRPKPPRNKLISAEDFANRPPVGFENEFSTYEDSMIALSWLDAKTCKQIYSTYVDMMVRHQTEHPGSSPEAARKQPRSSPGAAREAAREAARRLGAASGAPYS